MDKHTTGTFSKHIIYLKCRYLLQVSIFRYKRIPGGVIVFI